MLSSFRFLPRDPVSKKLKNLKRTNTWDTVFFYPISARQAQIIRLSREKENIKIVIDLGLASNLRYHFDSADRGSNFLITHLNGLNCFVSLTPDAPKTIYDHLIEYLDPLPENLFPLLQEHQCSHQKMRIKFLHRLTHNSSLKPLKHKNSSSKNLSYDEEMQDIAETQETTPNWIDTLMEDSDLNKLPLYEEENERLDSQMGFKLG